MVGIKGTVRRSTDGHLIHANVDTDVIVSETPAGQASTRKPEELYDIIERFALGRRRLELFGVDHNIRPGWVTLGNQLTTSNFDRDRYVSHFRESHLLENSPQIDKLRPKSPPRGEPGAPRGMHHSTHLFAKLV